MRGGGAGVGAGAGASSIEHKGALFDESGQVFMSTFCFVEGVSTEENN